MNDNNLKNYFPMIKTREQIVDEINKTPTLLSIFNSWNDEQQNSFLEICTGAKGVKMLYDSYFKEILNPEYDQDRLSYLLSVIKKKGYCKAGTFE